MIIDREDLYLTNTESKGVAKVLGSGKLDDKIVEQLNDRADGWVAGLLLMLGDVNSKEKHDISFVDSAPEIMFDYFSNEIFQKMDSDTQVFLSKTSILPHMTSKMAEELTGNRKANGILAQLNHNNFFTVIKDDEKEIVYQYHQLFQEFLIVRANDVLTPSMLIQLQKSAATLLEESGQVLETGELLLRFKLWEELGQLICRHAESIVTQGMNQLLLKWIEHIPDNMLENEPWLLYWLAVTRMPVKPSESITYFEKAFTVFKNSNDKTGTIMALSGALEAITHESNEFTYFDAWIEKLYQIKDGFQVSNPGRIEFQVVGGIFYALVIRKPEYHDFDFWKEMVLTLLSKSTNPNHRVFIAWPLGVHYYFVGDIANVKLMAGMLMSLAKTEQIIPLTFILAKLTASICFWMTAMFDEALDAANSGLDMAKKTGVHIWDLHLLSFCAATFIGLGKLKNAREYLKQMEPDIRKGTNNFHTLTYHFRVSWEAILRHDYTNAKIHAEMALKLGLDLQSTLPLASIHYAMSQILHEMGDNKLADKHLNETFQIAGRMKSAFIEFMCRIAKAQFAFDHGKNKEALIYLQEAMMLGRENSFENFFLWRPVVMARLCVKALENGIEKEYVQGLIRSRSLVPESPPLNLPDWPWQLKIYTLGKFAIVKDGKPLEFAGKTPRKPLALLKILIASGINGVTEHALSDILWPDAEGDAAHNTFSVTLKRLRELIDIEGIIVLQEGRVEINPCLCWIDARDFEQMIMKIDAEQDDTWNKEMSAETLKLAESTIDIYKGDFLGDETKNTQLSTYADSLKSKFTSSVNKLGHYMEERGDFNKAISCYQKGVSVDSTMELFYQRLMICYQQLGRKAIAIDTYEQCKKSIEIAFGVNVSKETREIYEVIKDGSN